MATIKMSTATVFKFFLLFVSITTGVNSATITLYDEFGHQGESTDVNAEVGQCVHLPGDWNDRVSSINTNDNCVIIFADGKCYGRSARMEPGSPSHDRLDQLNLDNAITSLQLCTPQDQECVAVTVDVDTSKAPDLAEFGEQIKSAMIEKYPLACRLLNSPTYIEINHINVEISPEIGGIGASAPDKYIGGSANYYRDHKDDIGSMIHEMGHIIQRYSQCDGWITEGIADWVRRFHYEAEKPGKPGPDDTYESQAVFFLNWIHENYGDVFYKVNGACRDGTYVKEIFQTLTSKTPDQLFEEMMNEI